MMVAWWTKNKYEQLSLVYARDEAIMNEQKVEERPLPLWRWVSLYHLAFLETGESSQSLVLYRWLLLSDWRDGEPNEIFQPQDA